MGDLRRFEEIIGTIHEVRKENTVAEAIACPKFRQDIEAAIPRVCSMRDKETLMKICDILGGGEGEFPDSRVNSNILCAVLESGFHGAIDGFVGEGREFCGESRIFIVAMKTILVDILILDDEEYAEKMKVFKKLLAVKVIPMDPEVLNKSFEYDLHQITKLILDDGRIHPCYMIPHRINVKDSSFKQLITHESCHRITDQSIKDALDGPCTDENRTLAIDFLNKRSK